MFTHVYLTKCPSRGELFIFISTYQLVLLSRLIMPCAQLTCHMATALTVYSPWQKSCVCVCVCVTMCFSLNRKVHTGEYTSSAIYCTSSSHLPWAVLIPHHVPSTLDLRSNTHTRICKTLKSLCLTVRKQELWSLWASHGWSLTVRMMLG